MCWKYRNERAIEIEGDTLNRGDILDKDESHKIEVHVKLTSIYELLRTLEIEQVHGNGGHLKMQRLYEIYGTTKNLEK